MKRFLCLLVSIFMLFSLFSVSLAEGKPFEGKTLTVLYMSSVYADAARAMAPEFEELTGATVDVVDFPYVTLHEKALLDLTSGGAAAFDVIDVAQPVGRRVRSLPDRSGTLHRKRRLRHDRVDR